MCTLPERRLVLVVFEFIRTASSLFRWSMRKCPCGLNLLNYEMIVSLRGSALLLLLTLVAGQKGGRVAAFGILHSERLDNMPPDTLRSTRCIYKITCDSMKPLIQHTARCMLCQVSNELWPSSAEAAAIAEKKNQDTMYRFSCREVRLRTNWAA